MFLDSFKLISVVFQIRYQDAFELWDRAGMISRQLCEIWSDSELETSEVKPQQQVLRGKDVTLETAFRQSTVTLTGEKSFDSRRIQQTKETFELWGDALKLRNVERISTLATYSKDFPTVKEANAELISFGLVSWPTVKVFDQPIDADLNGPQVQLRFEDASSFSVLRMRAEQVRLEASLPSEFFDQPSIEKLKNRLIVEFDRGLLGSVATEKFRVEEWLKGYQHILRRDIEKVIPRT